MRKHALLLRVFTAEKRDVGIVVHYCFVDLRLNIGVVNGKIDPVTHYLFAYFRTKRYFGIVVHYFCDSWGFLGGGAEHTCIISSRICWTKTRCWHCSTLLLR